MQKRKYSRKNASKKITLRRSSKRSTFSPQIPRGLYDPRGVYRFTRFADDATLTIDPLLGPIFVNNAGASPPWVQFGSPAADFPTGQQQGFSCAWRLSDLPDYGTIADFFQQYRIDAVEMKAVGILGDSASVAPGSPNIPFLYHAFDPNDATIPTGMEYVQEMGTCISSSISQEKPLTRLFKPCVAMALQSTGAAGIGFGEPSKAPWLDVTYTGTNHFGMKCWVRNLPFNPPVSNSGWGVRFSMKYYISVRRNQ